MDAKSLTADTQITRSAISIGTSLLGGGLAGGLLGALFFRRPVIIATFCSGFASGVVASRLSIRGAGAPVDFSLAPLTPVLENQESR